MIRFNNDYNHGAFASILKELGATNSTSYAGYGEDEWCDKAETIIKKLVDNDNALIKFIPGATQANYVVIAAALSSVQSVIAADTGHINCHEAASIENTGHKILELPNTDGKITAQQIAACAKAYYDQDEPEYLTEPKMRLHPGSPDGAGHPVRADVPGAGRRAGFERLLGDGDAGRDIPDGTLFRALRETGRLQRADVSGKGRTGDGRHVHVEQGNRGGGGRLERPHRQRQHERLCPQHGRDECRAGSEQQQLSGSEQHQRYGGSQLRDTSGAGRKV